MEIAPYQSKYFVAQEFAFAKVFNNFPIYNSFKLLANDTLEADGSIL